MDPLLAALIAVLVVALIALAFVSVHQQRARDRKLPLQVAEKTADEILRRLDVRPGERSRHADRGGGCS